MSNKLKEAIEVLGVSVGEEFTLKGFDKLIYKFSETYGLIYFDKTTKSWEKSEAFNDIVIGEYEIQKLPFKPKKMEKYHYISGNAGELYVVQTSFSKHSARDYTNVKVGNCFRTFDEAKANIEKYTEILQGEWQ